MSLRDALVDLCGVQSQDEVETLETEETMARSIQGDVTNIDKYMGEVSDLDHKISAQEARVSGGGTYTHTHSPSLSPLTQPLPPPPFRGK